MQKHIKIFEYNIPQILYSLKKLSQFYLVKSVKAFIKQLKSEGVSMDQRVRLKLKLSYSDGGVSTISTSRDATLKNYKNISSFFKHLLVLREVDKVSRSVNINKILIEYTIENANSEIELVEQDFKKEIVKGSLIYQEEKGIKYLTPLNFFKIPLSFAGSGKFSQQLLELNNTVYSIESEDNLKFYRSNYDYINSFETEFKLTLKDDPSIVVFKLVDKFIDLNKTDKNKLDYLIERTIYSNNKEIYLIDGLTNEIVLVKGFNNKNVNDKLKSKKLPNRKGINKFISFNIASLPNHLIDESENYFDPIYITGFDLNQNSKYFKTLRDESISKCVIPFKLQKQEIESVDRTSRKRKIKEFFMKFFRPKYHKFVFYTKTLVCKENIFLIESLMDLQESGYCKVDLKFQNKELIGVRVFFSYSGKRENFSHYIDIQDVKNVFKHDLEILSKNYLSENVEILKIEDKVKLQGLLYEPLENLMEFKDFWSEVKSNNMRDCMVISYVIKCYSKIIQENYKLNLHNYRTRSELIVAIYLTT